jgi:hypothetical protein
MTIFRNLNETKWRTVTVKQSVWYADSLPAYHMSLVKGSSGKGPEDIIASLMHWGHKRAFADSLSRTGGKTGFRRLQQVWAFWHQ